MRLNVLRWFALAALAAIFCGSAFAQDAQDGAPPDMPGAQRGIGRGFDGVAGQITAIAGSTITVQTFRGTTAKVKVTSSTRVLKDRAEAKLSEFQVGDRVFVGGDQGKDGVWDARILAKRTDGSGFPRGGAMGGMQFKPEDNGKTYIAGELTRIDGTKLTIMKPDNSEQVIEVDDDTSFRNQQRESITLADLKVGEFVRGMGELKAGVFVPKQLNAGRPRGPRAGSAPPPEGAVPTPPSAAPGVGAEKK